MRNASSPPGVIQVDRLWKRFRADRNRPVLRDEIARLTDYRKQQTDSRRWRWALRDINLDIPRGEAVGLFGANGSGKSTFLKILTRVMYPTAGHLGIGGRVGALIEVKAGVHPDLTGRENIFLYGSIMGLPRREIERKFDEIVDFAELGDALDRQLKYYSSGMAMRLGFAVAAFLEPDVLLVDEVLAVGDATFQQKCLDRMRAVLREGTTLVFVSHDLASVESISSRGIWLNNGVVAADGPIRSAISAYRQAIESTAELVSGSTGEVTVAASVTGEDRSGSPRSQASMHVDITLTALAPRTVLAFLGVSEGSSTPIFTLQHGDHLEPGPNRISCVVPSLPLPRGRYFLWAAITDTAGAEITAWHPVLPFDVQGPELEPFLPGITRLSPVDVGACWTMSAPIADESRLQASKNLTRYSLESANAQEA